jgi:hypothetical protein
VVVASADAPGDVKSAAQFVCTGTNDEAKINSAINVAAALVSRNPTSPGGAQQQGRVVLTGGRFNIDNPILMQTGVWLQGQGFLTEVRARANNGAGVIKLAQVDAHLCTVSHMWINGNSVAGGTCNGIDFDMTASGDTDEYPATDPDAYHLITDVYVSNFLGGTRHGIYLHSTGTANNRGNIIDRVQIRDCSGDGINLTAASDSFISNAHVGGSDGSGFRIASGNVRIVNSKSFFSLGWGFWISSGRGTITGCESQDDVNGYFFDAAPWTATGLTCDTADVTGIRVSTDRLTLNGFNVFLRSGGAFPNTNTGLLIDAGANDSIVTGQVDNSGITTPISGAVGLRSFMRVSDGTTLVSVG